MNEILFLPAVVMAERIREKKISPVEVVDAHLTQIENLNPMLNAFVHVDANAARRAAQGAEAAVMHAKTRKALGPLHGISCHAKKIPSKSRECVG